MRLKVQTILHIVNVQYSSFCSHIHTPTMCSFSEGKPTTTATATTSFFYFFLKYIFIMEADVAPSVRSWGQVLICFFFFILFRFLSLENEILGWASFLSYRHTHTQDFLLRKLDARQMLEWEISVYICIIVRYVNAFTFVSWRNISSTVNLVA